jgi:hypothetical protein
MACFFSRLKDLSSKWSNKVNSSGLVILAGDFNIDLSNISWQSDKLNNILLDNNLQCFSKQKTRITQNTSSQIDAIFTNSSSIREQGVMLTTISDHLTPFVIICNKNIKQKQQENITFRDLKEENINSLKSSLTNNPIELNPNSDANTIYEDLLHKFTKRLDTHCPKLTKPFTLRLNPLEPWMTKSLLLARRNKIRLHKLFIKNKTEENNLLFKNYQRTYNTMLRECKRDYCCKFYNDNKQNGRKMWDFTNDLLDRGKTKDPLPASFDGPNNTIITGDVNIANLLNKHFTSIGPRLSSKIADNNNYKKYLNAPHPNTLTFHTVSEETIVRIIDSMERKKSTSFDEISNALVKSLKNQLAKPLTLAINKSITEGIFPDKLKMAKIIALFKSGRKEDSNNYRPISLLAVFSKIYEKVIYRQLMDYFDEFFLTKYQFGFREWHETNNCILNYLNNIYTNKSHKYHLSLYIDLRKAFDTVPHNLLLNKLKYYGIDEKGMAWLTSYLSDRSQATDVNGHSSLLEIILCGVPQGSILGPLLFLIYINDLPSASRFLINLFADDTTLQFSGSNLKQLESEANVEIINIMNWFLDNKLSVHPQKTNCIIHKLFSKKNDPKKSVINLYMGNVKIVQCGKLFDTKSVKFLGVMVDDELNWNEHIRYVANKVRRVLFSLNKVKRSLPTATNIILFQSLAMPHFEYCLNIYGNSCQIQILVKLQKWGIRNATNSKYNAHTKPLFKANGILKIPELFTLKSSIILRKTIERSGPVILAEIFTYFEEKNRKKHVILEGRPVNKMINKFPNLHYPAMWNKLGILDIRPNISIFKNMIKKMAPE